MPYVHKKKCQDLMRLSIHRIETARRVTGFAIIIARHRGRVASLEASGSMARVQCKRCAWRGGGAARGQGRGARDIAEPAGRRFPVGGKFTVPIRK